VTEHEVAVREAAADAGLQVEDVRLLRHYANAVYVLRRSEGEEFVGRVATGAGVIERSRRSVVVTRWLRDLGFPATEPLDVEQPVTFPADDHERAVTLWRYYPQAPDRPPPGLDTLGTIARQLHEVAPAAPVDLPVYEPLDTMNRLVADDRARAVMGADTLHWLRVRIFRLRSEYAELQSQLGTGLIHGDMYAGNLMWDGSDVVLGDWDSVCTGPREIDLAPTFTAERFGLAEDARNAFAAAYGYDLRTWPGWPTLREAREISTMSALIRLAPTKPEAARELRYRLATLRADDRSARWAVQ
jgi:Ser/Thr protein kinase RdoA (MazF antagonist)